MSITVSVVENSKAVWQGFKTHPWRSLMGIIAALAFLPVCKYCSILILAGMIIWAIRKFG